MILSDADILLCNQDGMIGIKPLHKEQLQPASYDVRLGSEFRVFDESLHPYIDTRNIPRDLTKKIRIADIEKPFIIHPGQFVLGVSMEYFSFGPAFAGRLEGRSSLGRIGLVVHSTAGFFDPGFEGTATLEMTNIARIPILLYIGQRVAQMSFIKLSSPSARPYGHPERDSKYQHQVSPTQSKIDQDK